MNEPVEALTTTAEAPKIAIMTAGPSVELTVAQKETVKQMEPRISQFVAGHLQDKAFLERFRLSRVKIVPEVTTMTPALAKQIMEDMGIKLENDQACLLAYDIMGITENFGAIRKDNPPSDDQQKLAIQQRADTLANYAYDFNLDETENMDRLNRVLEVLK